MEGNQQREIYGDLWRVTSSTSPINMAFYGHCHQKSENHEQQLASNQTYFKQTSKRENNNPGILRLYNELFIKQ
jgi:hypothetical protein